MQIDGKITEKLPVKYHNENYTNDGDSVFRLFYDTVKGGDYRAREANVYRLAEVSNAIIIIPTILSKKNK